MSKHSHISAIFDNAFQSRAGSPDVYMSMVDTFEANCLKYADRRFRYINILLRRAFVLWKLMRYFQNISQIIIKLRNSLKIPIVQSFIARLLIYSRTSCKFNILANIAYFVIICEIGLYGGEWYINMSEKCHRYVIQYGYFPHCFTLSESDIAKVDVKFLFLYMTVW